MNPAQSQPLKILIVEDNSIDRELLKRFLSQSSLSISELKTASTLHKAFDILDQTDIDILLLDLNLPDSDGLDTLVSVDRKFPQLPIIVITGEFSEELGFKAVSCGAQEYLVKNCYNVQMLNKSVQYAIERKRIDNELRAAEQKYRTIFENSAVAITLVDEQERLISWNKFTELLLGMDKNDLYLKPIKTLYPSKEWQKIRDYNVRQKGMQHHLETKVIKKDGKTVEVDISLSVLKDSEGNPTGSIGVIRDITQRKKAQKILKREQRNLEVIFDVAPVGMLLIDENFIVRRANNVVQKLFQRDYTQIIGQQGGAALGCIYCVKTNDSYTCAPNCKKCIFKETIENVFAKGESVHEIEFQPRLKVGNKELAPWFCFSAEPAIIDDSKYVVAAVSDITARKEAGHKLKETMEIKSQFISTVSHELRTPLAAIREGVGILLDGLAGRINKKQKKFLAITKRNAERLNSLINDVLDFQKIESGKIRLDLQNNDIGQVVEEVHETMAIAAEKSKVNLLVEMNQNLPQARFDRNMMIQVLTNLVGNAIKFTPENGYVCIKVQSTSTETELVLTVKDTGIGIPKEDLPKIFERFYQVKRPGKEIKGTGLGLAIVNKIITMHGGRIEVESEQYRGTTFRVFLPINLNPEDMSNTSQMDEIIENALS
ncbi:MAG: PAS domain-containing sensor histidine kinase [Planctomycetota bacterium]|jgi:PAS domain S-box-containing protein